ncbi:Peroxidase [Bertholletia excelsa]
MQKIMEILFMFLFFLPLVTAQLRIGFYNSTCPRAEQIIRDVVQKQFNGDRSITAALLRMHFHDCFVQGCDASILIDSTPSQSSEKDAGPNLTVRGYELIDEIKRNLEAACPATVSCADIITLATRDAVALAGGPKYNVPTGRRDGTVSDSSLVDLPGPTLTVSEAFQFFKNKGLNLNDMVTLLGAHSVGPDPTMDSALVSKLFKTCGTQSRPLSSDPTAFLDQNTSFVMDNEFYKQIRSKKGVLQIDQELALDKSSAGMVSTLASNAQGFQQSFAKAMVKMGNIEILVGNAGQIRKNCRVFNK